MCAEAFRRSTVPPSPWRDGLNEVHCRRKGQLQISEPAPSAPAQVRHLLAFWLSARHRGLARRRGPPEWNHLSMPAAAPYRARMSDPRKVLVLVGSPRKTGNSAALAEAAARGARASGADVALRFVDDHIQSFLRDCRSCRQANGECGIADGYRGLFWDEFLPAEGII